MNGSSRQMLIALEDQTINGSREQLAARRERRNERRADAAVNGGAADSSSPFEILREPERP
jgi:hypothetical protein